MIVIKIKKEIKIKDKRNQQKLSAYGWLNIKPLKEYKESIT